MDISIIQYTKIIVNIFYLYKIYLYNKYIYIYIYIYPINATYNFKDAYGLVFSFFIFLKFNDNFTKLKNKHAE